MKYLPLIWSGLWRKPVRTGLILFQVAMVFALFGILQGMKSGVERAVANTRADILIVFPALFGGTPLPIAYRERLQSIPGVKLVSYADSITTTYQRPTQTVGVFAVAPDGVWEYLDPQLFQILPKDLEALQRSRTGALMSADIGKKYGWHIGQRVPLTSPTLQSNGSGTWYFDIVGMVTDREFGEGSLIVTNYDYLDQARAKNKGTVRNFYVLADDPKHASALAERIDHAFANSSNETRTISLREGAQQSMRAIGDLNFGIRAILGAAVVALLFSTATMMMQTIRERTAEFAVLKTLGFTDRAVFLNVTAEGLLVCVVGALAGLGLACAIFPFAAKFISNLSMPLAVIGFGVIGAVLVALVSSALPAARAARLKVVDALAAR
jgi:putative ABC transport system permease protein